MRLEKWLTKHGMSAVGFADIVGLDHSTIYRIISGERMPSLEVACVIHHYTNGEVLPETFLQATPEGYRNLWRENAKNSSNPERRSRALKLSEKDAKRYKRRAVA